MYQQHVKQLSTWNLLHTKFLEFFRHFCCSWSWLTSLPYVTLRYLLLLVKLTTFAVRYRSLFVKLTTLP